jgi:hypothetical protein
MGRSPILPNTIVVRDFNRQLRDDPRILKVLLPIADD